MASAALFVGCLYESAVERVTLNAIPGGLIAALARVWLMRPTYQAEK